MPSHRGDLVLSRVPMPSTGFTQFKLRPAIVVSKDVNNQRLDVAVVAPCASNFSGSSEPTQCLVDGVGITTAGIRVPSAVRCEALMTIPKVLIVRTLGRLSNAAVAVVNDCPRDALAL